MTAGPKVEGEVELAKDRTVSNICKQLAITDQTYYRRRKEYGALGIDQALQCVGLSTTGTGGLVTYTGGGLDERDARRV